MLKVAILIRIAVAQERLNIAWGAGTSAYQIEGGYDVDGKRPSIWDTWFSDPIRADGPNGNIAADHYNHMKEDIKLLGDMGATAYRFSVSWPRIIPDCTGKVNEAGIKFYSDMINEIIKNGALPILTLFHWDIPEACHTKYGSMLSIQIVKDFTAFAEVVLDRLGDRLEYILTLNEPSAHCGYGYGQLDSYPKVHTPTNNAWLWPPGVTSPSQLEADRKKYLCMHHINLAHGSVVQMSRKKYGKKFKYGLPLIISNGMPFSNSQADIDATKRFFDFQTGFIWDVLQNGDYPDVLKKNPYYSTLLTREYTTDEKAMMKGTLDFMAVNYYTSSWVKAAPFDYTKSYEGPPLGYSAGDTGPDGVQMPYVSATSWASYFPSGIRGLCKSVFDKYQLDIWISESGTSVKGEVKMTNAEIIDDKVRQGFFQEVTAALKESITIDKIPVKAFLAWSLLDNFEWLTYDQRFGLVSIERGDDTSRNNTLKRTVKNSFIWLKDYFAANSKTPFVLPKQSNESSGKEVGYLILVLSALGLFL